MECKQDDNLERCNCTWEGCPRKGKCCDCLQHHWKRRELPACLFPDDVEQSYDRSLERFIEIYS